jgi:hypothetical protein
MPGRSRSALSSGFSAYHPPTISSGRHIASPLAQVDCSSPSSDDQPAQLSSALRAAAEGIHPDEAAAGLIVSHGTFLHREDFIRHIGSVGSGLAEAEARDLTARLLSLEQPDSPFAAPVPADVARRARWTRPVLAAEVVYAGIAPAGRMRHPVWCGLRPA